ncbi:MAG: mandelate racemase/muconate lactonizing enzyme family protein [Acidimicrobiales bacterium]|nr:mandelate racemase/muconate lactonizing enzyme family protein [Acidimicrobiales bacterium]
MKIAEFETFVVANPPPHFGGRYFLFVKLVTDGGTVGYGEVYCATFGPHTVARMIEDVCERHVVGTDARQIELLGRRIYGSGYTARPDASLGAVASGIEMACWDVVGKELGQPVHQLLGGRVHERLRTYTYLYPRADDGPDAFADNRVYRDPELAAERAAQEVARGFTGVKFDPAGPYTVVDGRQPSLEALDRTEAFVRLIREAVGDRADLLVGTHGQFTPSGALRLARRIEPYDPMWFEEPTPPENPAAMATVAAGTSIPIATGERLTTPHEFARVLEAGAASILQPNAGRCGGISAGRKIAAIAEVAGAQLAPHLYCGPIVAAANIAIAVGIPNFAILEAIEDFGGFHAELLAQPIRWEDGYVIPSDRPGLGHDLDEEVARAHPYEGDELHLSMQETPEAR